MSIPRIARFASELDAALAEPAADEAALLARVRPLMAALVEDDGWLPRSHAEPHPVHYQQYLLHRDPGARYSLVSFVWGPGQRTPVHDHTVWGVIGMLRGGECDQRYRRQDGRLEPDGPEHTLLPGMTAMVSPRLGDIHRVRNLHQDRVSVSIHLYGGDIGAIERSVFDPADGRSKVFVSGYAAPRADLN